MPSHVGIPVLFGHDGVENKSRSPQHRGEGVGGAVMTERVGLRASDEKPPLCAGHRAAHDNDAQGAARPGDLAGEVDPFVDAGAVAAQMERDPRPHVQGQVGGGLERSEAVGDPEGPRRSPAQLERPAAGFIRRRGADQVEGTAGQVGVALEADLGARDRVARRVAQAPADQCTATESNGPLALVVAREAGSDRVTAADRRAGAEVVDQHFLRFAGAVRRSGLRVVVGADRDRVGARRFHSITTSSAESPPGVDTSISPLFICNLSGSTSVRSNFK